MNRQRRNPPSTPTGVAAYLVVVGLASSGLWVVLTLPEYGVSWGGVAVAGLGGLLFAVVTLVAVSYRAGRHRHSDVQIDEG